MSHIIAVKLGSSNTSIYKEGEGLVLFEPSMVAFTGEGRAKNVIAVGSSAKKMQGRTDDSIIVCSPIKNGKIIDPELATVMLKTFLFRTVPSSIIKPKIKAIVTIPMGLDPKERKLTELVFNTAGVQDVIIIPSIVAGAIGYNLPVSEPEGLCLVNIGGGSTDVAVVSVNSIVSGINVSIGGETLDQAIEKAVLDAYQLQIGVGVAEKIKEEIGSLYSKDSSNAEVNGIDVDSGTAKSVIVESSVVYNAIISYYDKIADAIQATIKNCPANIIEDVYNRGVFMMGGASLITGAEQYFRKRMNIPVIIQDHTTAVDVIGAGKLIANPKLLKEISSL